MSYSNAIEEMKELWESKLAEIVKRQALAVEDLTERQLVEAIRQAIACGDFQRYVKADGGGQQVVYIPFAQESLLQAQIKELVEQLRLAKSLCTVCGEYLPGHATGGADICTCQ